MKGKLFGRTVSRGAVCATGHSRRVCGKAPKSGVGISLDRSRVGQELSAFGCRPAHIPSLIWSQLSLELHRRSDHPLGIIRQAIEEYLGTVAAPIPTRAATQPCDWQQPLALAPPHAQPHKKSPHLTGGILRSRYQVTAIDQTSKPSLTNLRNLAVAKCKSKGQTSEEKQLNVNAISGTGILCFEPKELAIHASNTRPRATHTPASSSSSSSAVSSGSSEASPWLVGCYPRDSQISFSAFFRKELPTYSFYSCVDFPPAVRARCNFDELRIPPTHPSRSRSDTFYLPPPSRPCSPIESERHHSDHSHSSAPPPARPCAAAVESPGQQPRRCSAADCAAQSRGRAGAQEVDRRVQQPPGSLAAGVYHQETPSSQWLLRTQATAHQAALLRQGHRAAVWTAMAVRRDEVDALHFPIFHQTDALHLWTPKQALILRTKMRSLLRSLITPQKPSNSHRRAQSLTDACPARVQKRGPQVGSSSDANQTDNGANRPPPNSPPPIDMLNDCPDGSLSTSTAYKSCASPSSLAAALGVSHYACLSYSNPHLLPLLRRSARPQISVCLDSPVPRNCGSPRKLVAAARAPGAPPHRQSRAPVGLTSQGLGGAGCLGSRPVWKHRKLQPSRRGPPKDRVSPNARGVARGWSSPSFRRQVRCSAIVHLQLLIEGLIDHLLGPSTQRRWDFSARFPFTSPSIELEVFDATRQRWVEVLGCGAIHPSLIRGLHHFPRGTVGWAVGIGLDRLAMLLFDIPDIRLLWSTDSRFSSQFAACRPDNIRSFKFKPFSKFPPIYKDFSFWLPPALTRPSSIAPNATQATVDSHAQRTNRESAGKQSKELHDSTLDVLAEESTRETTRLLQSNQPAVGFHVAKGAGNGCDDGQQLLELQHRLTAREPVAGTISASAAVSLVPASANALAGDATAQSVGTIRSAEEEMLLRDIHAVCREGAGDALECVKLVDEYCDPCDSNRRSWCFRLTYRDLHKNLQHDQVNVLQEHVRLLLKQQLKLTLR
eukprot:GHVT01095437.1.p1 GENE.GHVT01095437.1~~GHVT01095437.1.p1  ORF type:complete len:1001 (-),score=155.25 GHVT01095437.1:3832-6834(-)